MTTSGTHTFNLDLSDIMEEAYDLAGVELRSGYSLSLIHISEPTRPY